MRNGVPILVTVTVGLALACGGGGATTPPRTPTAAATPTVETSASTLASAAPSASTSTAPCGSTPILHVPGRVTTSSLGDEIRRVVVAKMGDLRRCYDEAQAGTPTLHGSVVVRWHIDTDGHVSEASISSSTACSPKLEQCMLDVFRSMTFGAPEGGRADASWAFQFAPP